MKERYRCRSEMYRSFLAPTGAKRFVSSLQKATEYGAAEVGAAAVFFCSKLNQGRPDLLFRRNHFGVDSDGYFVADHTWAVRDAKVLASDFGAGVNADALVAPGVFDGSGRTIDIQDDFFRSAANGEVAGDFELSGSYLFNLLGFERDGGEVLGVEEMIAFEIL